MLIPHIQYAYNVKFRKDNLGNGLCQTGCKKPVVPGTLRCAEHTVKHKEDTVSITHTGLSGLSKAPGIATRSLSLCCSAPPTLQLSSSRKLPAFVSNTRALVILKKALLVAPIMLKCIASAVRSLLLWMIRKRTSSLAIDEDAILLAMQTTFIARSITRRTTRESVRMD